MIKWEKHDNRKFHWNYPFQIKWNKTTYQVHTNRTMNKGYKWIKKKRKASHKVRNKSSQYKNKFTFTMNKYDVS